MLDELHPQLYPLLFDYLTQQELVDCLLLNRLLYREIMKYIKSGHIQTTIESDDIFAVHCRMNNIISIKYISTQKLYNHSYRLYCACLAGNMKLVDYWIRKGMNNWAWPWGLHGASIGGHLEIAKYIIKKGQYENALWRNDLNSSMHYACAYKRNDIIRLLIDKGATECTLCHKTIKEHIEEFCNYNKIDGNRNITSIMLDELHPQLYPLLFDYLTQQELVDCLLLNRLLYREIMKYIRDNGYMKVLIEYFYQFQTICKMNHIISIKRINLDDYHPNLVGHGLYEACKLGYGKLIRILSKYNNPKRNICGFGLWGASLGGQLEIAKQMIENGATNMNGCLASASCVGHLNIVQLLIDNGADYFNDALEDACKNGHEEIVKLLLEKGADRWDISIAYAIRNGHYEIAKLIIKKGKPNLNAAISAACRVKNKELMRLLIVKGATRCTMCVNQLESHIID